MQVQIRFKATGWNSALGNFGPRDTAWVSAEMAAHLVSEAGAAEYVEPPVVAAVEPAAQPAPVPVSEAGAAESAAPAEVASEPAPAARKRRGS